MPVPKSNKADPVLMAGCAHWWLVLALGLALTILYSGSWDAPLLFDDAGAITHNESIRHLNTALTPPPDGSTTTGRPVLNLSFALNYALTGESLRGWHIGNGLIHAATAMVLFGLILVILRRPVFRSLGVKNAEWLAFTAALLWGVHPLLTESVVGIAQRSESLCALFYAGVLFCFAKAAAHPVGRRWPWYAASVAFSFLGMAAKEVMVTAPLMVFLFDRTFFAGGFVPAWRERRGFYLALFCSWSILALLMLSGGGTRGSSAGLGLGIGAWPYLLKQTEAIMLYLRLSVWPSPLVLDYGTGVVDSLAEVWWQALLVTTLLLGTLWALWKKPLLGLVGAWFFVILAPSSSFVPLVSQTMAEHRMYLPLAGLVTAVVIWTWCRLGRWTGPVLVGVALILGGMTVARERDYRTVLGIWRDSVTKYPQSARAQLNLGVELLDAQHWSEARSHLQKAAELSPGYALAHYNGGLTWQAEGRIPEALAEYQLAVGLAPANPDIQVNLGNALVLSGRASEALPHYEAALRLKSAGDVHFNWGQALTRLNRREEAWSHFEAALQLEPANTNWRSQLALDYAQAGKWSEATHHFQALIKLLPDDAAAHANYGNVLLLSGHAAAAVGEYETALRLRPGDAQAAENLRIAREELH